ncbi:hypothetical protein DIE00_27395 [Burkholderia sp. Bp8989]|nr:hypothetical protein DIE05_07920 [Burkholderia sp. Bp8995]RQS41911.1 hypothetical protein DIE00_27395 [Burkholderia sp. Bp8989]
MVPTTLVGTKVATSFHPVETVLGTRLRRKPMSKFRIMVQAPLAAPRLGFRLCHSGVHQIENDGHYFEVGPR